MTLYGRIKEFFTRDLALTNEKAWNPALWVLPGSQSLAGEVVTESTALTYSAVFNAVLLISQTVGSLPLHLMQCKDDKKRVADKNPLYRVMHDRANEYMTAMTLREVMMSHILTWGNGYAEIVRNEYGEITALWPITPNRVRILQDGEKIYYAIRMSGIPDVTLPREKVLHIPGLGYDGFQGYSVIGLARKTIGLGMALETFGSLYFGNGTHPGTIVAHPGKLSQQGHENLQSSLVQAHSGLGKSHRLLLLEEGMKVEKFGIPPNDSQFLESRQYQIPEIARWFNVPPHKLKDLTKSSFSNIESEQQSFYVDTILPWLSRLEANYNMQLLDEFDKSMSGYGRLYFKHSAEGILRGDTAARGEFYTKMFNIGVLSVNEIRALEDRDPVTGGDVHYVPMNMQPLAEASKPKPPALPPAPPALPPGKGNGKGEEGEAEGEEEGSEA